DVPANAVAVGVPARVVCQNGKPTTEAPLDLDPSVADALPQAMATMQKQLTALQADLTLAQQRLQRVEEMAIASVPTTNTPGQGI
ncbi:MAG: hypothetical protein ACK5WY_08045, partial [Holosporaceae bacterium]